MRLFILLLAICLIFLGSGFCVGQDPRLVEAEFTSMRVDRDQDGKVVEVLAGYKFENDTFALVVVKNKDLIELAARIYARLETTVMAQTALDAEGNRIVPELDAKVMWTNYKLVESKLGAVIRDEELGLIPEKELKTRVKEIGEFVDHVEGMLNHAQLKALNEIGVTSDIQGFGVLTVPSQYPAADVLEISQEQRKELIKQKEKLQAEFLEELEGLLKKHEAKILNPLSEEQKKKWKEIQGQRPVYLEKHRRERFLGYLNL